MTLRLREIGIRPDHRASETVDRFSKSGVRFSADAMNLLHAMISDRQPGVTRKAGQDVSRGKLYLPGSQVDAAVEKIFQEVAAGGAAAPALVARFDQKMISVHPYLDGNGRTTRLMTDWLLTRAGYPPVIAPTSAATALFAGDGSVARGANFVRITDGVRRTVALLETVV